MAVLDLPGLDPLLTESEREATQLLGMVAVGSAPDPAGERSVVRVGLR